MNSKEFDDIRKKINGIDSKIVELLSDRYKLAEEIVRIKDVSDKPIRDPDREKELLRRIIELGKAHNLDEHFLTKIYHIIIDRSVKLQHDYLQRLANQNTSAGNIIRLSIQGIEGSYSYSASKKFFSGSQDQLSFLSFKRFDEVVSAVEKGDADYAVLPIENTTSGGINETYDLLMHTTLSIVGEERYEIEHCLIGIDNVELTEINKIYAHYQAAAQCSKFVDQFKDTALEYFADTAMSVRKVKEEKNPEYAAIASEDAAALFNMKILAKNIANQSENFTRFLVCARKPIKVDMRIPCKTSLVFATSHVPGSLFDALGIFRDAKLNMTKLESRPILGNPWEAMIYLDFEGNVADEKVQEVLINLEKHTRFSKVLGCYPAQSLPPTKVNGD